MKPLLAPHIPTIPGLRHGGMAQAMRRRMTPFGSGWQGINIEALENAYEGVVTDVAGQLRQSLEDAYESVAIGPSSISSSTSISSRSGPSLEGLRATREAFADVETLHGVAKQALPFVKTPIYELGHGFESVAFSVAPDKVLKITPMHNRKFTQTQGHLKLEELADVPEVLQPIASSVHKQVEARVMPMARVATGRDSAAIDKVRLSLADRGLEWTDYNPRNAGWVGTELKIIDPGFIQKADKAATVARINAHSSTSKWVREILAAGVGEAAKATSGVSSSRAFQGARRMLSHL